MADKPKRVSDHIIDAARVASASGQVTVEEVTKKTTGDGLEARSVSQTIRTVEDLLRHIEADLTKFEVAASEATTWQGLTADKESGRPIISDLFRVFVRLRPKAGPGVKECVEAMISAAAGSFRERPFFRRRKNGSPRKSTDRTWAVLVVADVHYGKYAWKKSTGEADYDLDIADRLVRESSTELLAAAAGYRPSRVTVAGLGDLFHYDTPSGTTTSGTPLERDGRIQKMIAVGTESLLSVVDTASEVGKTDAIVVNGNHDETLTWAFHRILIERYAKSRLVTVDETYTPRKYLTHHRNLLGFAHGHRAKRRLPQLMAHEAAAAWATCPYREIHTGHLHHQAAEWQRPIETIDGVLVRVAPSLGAADDWHASSGFLGSRRAMELYVYDEDGGLRAMHVAGPRLEIGRLAAVPAARARA
jgi:metallophosphoesterase superfamily enzyme